MKKSLKKMYSSIKKLNSKDEKQAQSKNSNIPFWKIILILLLFFILVMGIFLCLKGYVIAVLSFTSLVFLAIGILLVFIFLISKETFLLIIGKRSEYKKIVSVSQVATASVLKAGVNYLPIGLENEEKERIIKDIPTIVEMRFLSGLNNFIIRIFIGAFATAFGLLGTIVLMKQNEKIEVQNELFSSQNNLVSVQNEQIKIQSFLLESQRRSSYNFRLNNIFDRIDIEIREQKRQGAKKFELSNQLIGRISALSKAFKPYQYLENGEITKRPFSPERGQLLIALTNSDLKNETLDKIYKLVDFTYSELENVTFNKTYLNGVNLNNAHLSNTVFYKADLSNSSFNGAYMPQTVFENLHLSNSSFDFAWLKGSSFRNGIKLDGISFCEADLNSVKITDAILNNIIFTCLYESDVYLDMDSIVRYNTRMISFTLENSIVDGLNFARSDISYSKFKDVNLNGSIFRGANIDFTLFKNVDLRNVDFSKSMVPYPRMDFEHNTLMTDCVFDSTKVGSKNWIIELKEIGVDFDETVDEGRIRINNKIRVDKNGKNYHFISDFGAGSVFYD